MPELNPKALHGLAGKLAERVQPQMEVSAVAVAADYLCALGNCVGPKVQTFANGDYEAGNFNVLKPGLTGVAKSHTAKPVERVFTTADPFWNERIEYDVYTPQALMGTSATTTRTARASWSSARRSRSSACTGWTSCPRCSRGARTRSQRCSST